MSSQGRQLSSLAPNIQPKEPTKKPNVPSPASLLWAHQLHREQNALSIQISELESSLKSSITTANDSILAKLDAFTGQLDSLRNEIEQLRRDGAVEAEKLVASLEDKLSEKFSGVDERLSTAFGRNYEMTSEMVREEIGRVRDELVDAFKAVVAESRQQQKQQQQVDTPEPRQRTPSPVPGDEPGPDPDMKQSTLVEPNSPSQPVVIWQDNVHPLSTVPGTPIEPPSAQAGMAIDIETRDISCPPQTVAKDTQMEPPELIMQGPIPLSDFLELGSAYITLGYVDSQVAFALWKGLNELGLRRLVAKEMPENHDQWTCTKFVEVVRRLDRQKAGMDKDAEKAAVKPVEGRIKRRRRVISVVWPTDEEGC
ncbi:hypothetical protein MGYG_06604 [Nannizzia gypsea CBS 118893]|uniref:Uncharacterized protein n=1 Tax=Arthroderma gypseum (strain ATCC MYA-4604 / CBS 118893) TaxID=535722 RepID=E4V2P8_ARTGP|nr:hypothetical protein MGYG_06604 [Nannizzia gypsea CBS 118893]EFR03610.1 hypothetical protein MGYG_06604 [Nannizzia gypsea CBS 118893]